MTLLKTNSNTGIFLWILKSLKQQFAYRKPVVAASVHGYLMLFMLFNGTSEFVIIVIYKWTSSKGAS